jgi:hypothetical protein
VMTTTSSLLSSAIALLLEEWSNSYSERRASLFDPLVLL